MQRREGVSRGGGGSGRIGEGGTSQWGVKSQQQGIISYFHQNF